MRSWTVEDLVTGERRDALGRDPRGCITYTRDGRVTVLVVAGERIRPAELVPTIEEKVALYDTMFAYAGTFAFDGTKVIHHIDVSWNEAWSGTSQVRFCELRGDVLTYGISVAHALTKAAELVGEVNGRLDTRAGEAPPATESRGVARVGGRYTTVGWRTDVGVLFGVTSRDPDIGMLAGFTYVFNAFKVP